jgi:hypothetical protein
VVKYEDMRRVEKVITTIGTHPILDAYDDETKGGQEEEGGKEEEADG